MPDVSFGSLLVVAVMAVLAPLLVGLFPAIRVPAVVLEIVAGIVLGPSGLGWVEVDLVLQVLSLMGLAFLLFLAGLEIDLERLRGQPLKLAGIGCVLSLAIGLAAGVGFAAAGWVKGPVFIAIVLTATSLGLIVPVLKNAGQVSTGMGQLTIAGATVADFTTVLLLTLFFSEEATDVSAKLVLVGGFAVAVVVALLALTELSRSMRFESALVRLQDTTAEIRVRIAVAILVGFVALAENLGLETILGAFVAGVLVALVDRRNADTHPRFRLKLEAIGYGFLIPVFFVTSGLRLDLGALLDSPSAFARVPLFLLALLLVRGIPALLYAKIIGRRRAIAAGLLQATSLPFIVTAVQIGLILGEVSDINGTALVMAGLLSVVLFPSIALGLLKGTTEPVAAAMPEARPLAT